MKRCQQLLSGIGIAGLLLCCCATTSRVQAPPSLAGVVLADTTRPAVSVVNIPVEFKEWYLQELLNTQLDSLLWACDTVTLGSFRNVQVRVWKSDSIRIGINGNEISYRLPLHILMRFSLSLNALGLSHTEYQDVEAGIALSFKSKIGAQNGWKITTETQSLGYEWLSDPVIRSHFITIPIKPLAELLLSQQQARFGTMVDEAIGTMLDLRKIIQPFWSQIQQPILLSPENRLWLRIQPLGVTMTPFTGTAGRAHCSVGIKTVAEAVFGQEPPALVQDSLPDFSVTDSIDSSFVINLYSELSYPAATGILQGYLLGRSFSAGKREVIIQNVELLGVDGYAVVALEFTGDFRGKVYVFGNLIFDPASSTLSVENLDFDLTTKNALHSTADWLFHGIIQTKVKPFLKFPLREKLLESQLLIQKMVSHRALSKDLYLVGSIDSLAIGGIKLTDRGIRSILLARGSLNVLVHD